MILPRVHVEISNICNLQCHFCPEVERPKREMRAQDFAQIAAQLSGKVREVCLHLMGEPLQHPEFAEILAICQRYELPVNLTTNGFLLQGERKMQALHPIIRQVNISLQSFEGNFGQRDVTPYLEKIFRFTRAAEATRPDLYVNLRLWDLTEGQPVSSCHEALRQGIEAEFATRLPREALDVRRRKSVALRGRIYGHFDSRFTWPSPQLPLRSTHGFCHGLSQHVGIHADGTLVPCCLDKEAHIKLGNVFQQSLADILASERAVAMQEGFARGELREDLCRRCPFIARFDRKARRLRAQMSQPVD